MSGEEDKKEDAMTVTIQIDGISHMRDMLEAIYSAGISHHESGRGGLPIPMPNISQGQHIGGREINTDVEHDGRDTFGNEVLCEQHDYVVESTERGISTLRCRNCNSVTTVAGNIVSDEEEENLLEEDNNSDDEQND